MDSARANHHQWNGRKAARNNLGECTRYDISQKKKNWLDFAKTE